MPAHLQAAKDRSMAQQKAKETEVVEAPDRVTTLGLRKTPKGYEVVRFYAPAADVMVVSSAEPLQYASQALLTEIRMLLAGVP